MRKPLFFLFFLLPVISFTQNQLSISGNKTGTMGTSFRTAKQLALAVDDSLLGQGQKLHNAYLWITANISYDVKSYAEGIIPQVTPSDVLKQRKALCGGYAVLLDSLCKYLNIQSFIVNGYSKSIDFNPEDGFTSSNHSWNAVYVNDEWKFIDATWASGFVSKTRNENFLNKLFKKPAIKNKYVFTQSRNDSFYMAPPGRLIKTHLPANPMWQMNYYPVSVKQFVKQNFESDSSDGYFNYTDTLQKFMDLSEEKRIIFSAIQAYNFYPLNYFDAAQAYINAGLRHYNYSTNIIPVTSKLYEKEINYSKQYLAKGIYFLSKGTLVSDSVYKNKISVLKSDYKKTVKKLKTLKKSNEKLLTLDQKLLNDNNTLKLKLKDNIRELNRTTYDMYGDDKIYYIERPDYLPDYFDSLKIARNNFVADSLIKGIRNVSDTLGIVYKNKFDNFYDTITYFHNKLPYYADTSEMIFSNIQFVASENFAETFRIIRPLIEVIDSVSNEMLVISNIIKNSIKNNSKDNHNLVKGKLKKIVACSKDAKKALIEIKKINFRDCFEEDRYDSLTEMVINEYFTYIDNITKEIGFIDGQSNPVKEEMGLIKNNIKTINKTIAFIDLYYSNNYENLKVNYANEKARLKSINKLVTSVYNTCLKQAGTKKAG